MQTIAAGQMNWIMLAGQYYGCCGKIELDPVHWMVLAEMITRGHTDLAMTAGHTEEENNLGRRVDFGSKLTATLLS